MTNRQKYLGSGKNVDKNESFNILWAIEYFCLWSDHPKWRFDLIGEIWFPISALLQNQRLGTYNYRPRQDWKALYSRGDESDHIWGWKQKFSALQLWNFWNCIHRLTKNFTKLVFHHSHLVLEWFSANKYTGSRFLKRF